MTQIKSGMLNRLAILGIIHSLATIGILASQATPRSAPKQGVAESHGSQSTQQQERSQTPDQNSSNSPSVVVQIDTQRTDNSDADKRENLKIERENIQIQWILAGFTGLLVIVTGGLVVVGYLQYGMMGEHKKGLDRLLGGIKRQTDLMSRNNVITLATARSAQESAKAANDQIRMVKDKERARLEIDFDDFVFDPSIKLFFLQKVDWRVTLHGQTEATILKKRMVASIGEPEEDPFDFGVYEMILPNILTPLERIARGNCMVSATAPILGAIGNFSLDSLRDQKGILYCTGQITFKDVFGDVWELPFKRKWDYSRFGGGKMDAEGWGGKWVQEGDNEERKAT